MNQLIEKIIDRFDDNENNLELQPWTGAVITLQSCKILTQKLLCTGLVSDNHQTWTLWCIFHLLTDTLAARPHQRTPLDFLFHAVL